MVVRDEVGEEGVGESYESYLNSCCSDLCFDLCSDLCWCKYLGTCSYLVSAQLLTVRTQMDSSTSSE